MNICILTARQLRPGVIAGIFCGLVALSLGCGGDDTVSPIPPDETGIPDVPVMTNPDQDPPMRSQTVSIVAKSCDFAPRISKAHGSWKITGRGTYEAAAYWEDCPGAPQDLYTGSAWSDRIPPFTGCFAGCVDIVPPVLTHLPYCPVIENGQAYDLALRPEGPEWPDGMRFVFIKEFNKDPSPTATWDAPRHEICRVSGPIVGCISKVHIFKHYEVAGAPIEKTPYMCRDRFWMAIPWQSGAIVERTTGNETIALTSTYTSGSSRTETESFAWTLGASVGADIKGVQAQVQGSITRTFETAFTVKLEETVSISRTLQGEANRRTCFVLWVLVEQYSFVDSEGKEFTDPNYELHPGFYDQGGDKHYDIPGNSSRSENTCLI
jgi:hypothetical protein